MLYLIEMIHTKMEIGILYVRPNRNYFTLFTEDGEGLNIIKDENYAWGIYIEKNKFKPLGELRQNYTPDNGDSFTVGQKRKILSFLFKEF